MDSFVVTSAADAGAAGPLPGRGAVALEVDAGPGPSAVPPSPSRASLVERSGMRSGHDVLLALIMAVAMAATVFLYR